LGSTAAPDEALDPLPAPPEAVAKVLPALRSGPRLPVLVFFTAMFMNLEAVLADGVVPTGGPPQGCRRIHENAYIRP
jgi:hypothetical protein